MRSRRGAGEGGDGVIQDVVVALAWYRKWEVGSRKWEVGSRK